MWVSYLEATRALADAFPSDSTPGGEGLSLLWSYEDAGWLAEHAGPLGDIIAWLDFGGGSLWVERREPQEGAWIELHGRSRTEIGRWVASAAARLAGSAEVLPRPVEQANDPANTDDTDARADLEALYEGAGLLLNALLDAAEKQGFSTSAPRLDACSLRASLEIATAGIPDSRGVEVQFSPPSNTDPLGGWSIGIKGDSGRHLSVGDFQTLPTGEAQQELIADFIVAASNELLATMKD